MYTKIAHINKSGEIQTIQEHLQGTAERAKEFASEFGCGEVGYLCGLMHDIGKYSEEFQKRIQNPKHSKKVDHSTAGAKELCSISSDYIPIAMAVAGHHSGLLDGGQARLAQSGTFFGRLKNELPKYQEWKREIEPTKASVPAFCMTGRHAVYTMSFFIRMIYSCLVDADYLDTEAFMTQNPPERGRGDSMTALLEKLQCYITPWLESVEFSHEKQRLLCENRTRILMECLEKGGGVQKGLYTLTVPTGGGKTTASLGFALKHAAMHHMKRIIYVIPYRSIIDQNAAKFSEILGEENVLEHHSGVLYDATEDQVQNAVAYRKIFASENWDKPVIVTTAVQFFESLYACKSSKCRKLHNIANSVIIFDEAQTLPVNYLEPCVAAISELVAHYGVTAVLCTATQPVLGSLFEKYLPNMSMNEICSGMEYMYECFKRTIIKDIGTLSLEGMLEKLTGKQQYLCIVNKRITAQEFYKNIEHEGAYCLTTLLCPVDRKTKIAEIRQRLYLGLPCRVIATSLVEAGVDLDFPEVFRQEAGLDSVVQAAGRCNREGKRSTEKSVVSVFQLEGSKDLFLGQNVSAFRWTQKKYEDVADQRAVEFYFQYYRELLGRENLDQKEIIKSIENGWDGSCFPFASVAGRFHLIENDTATIYIPVGEGEELIEAFVTGIQDRDGFRKLGQYSVNIYPEHLKALWDSGCLEQIGGSGFVLRDLNRYSRETGLQMDVDTGYGVFV
jgi:CRISPR-associated endonuclease/helicase Cas3